MIANTRKMYELKLMIAEMLKQEKVLSEDFNNLVLMEAVTEEKLKEFKELMGEDKNKEITFLTKEEIMTNPYLKDIKITKVQKNDIELSKTRIIKAHTVTHLGEQTRDKEGLNVIDKYFICDKALHLPCIASNGGTITWMSVEPMEIESFKSFIHVAKGNVLLVGCGLGYVAYMLSLKEEVNHIWIVELNQDIIDIFMDYLLPQFKNFSKVTVVKFEALAYLETKDLNTFDYVNVDIWRDKADMLIYYLPVLEIEKRYPKVEFSYWLETELKAYMQKSILQAFVGVENHDKLAEAIAEDLIFQTEINSLEDLKGLLQLSNFREIFYQWYINHKESYEVLRETSEQRIGNATHLMGAFLRRALKK